MPRLILPEDYVSTQGRPPGVVLRDPERFFLQKPPKFLTVER